MHSCGCYSCVVVVKWSSRHVIIVRLIAILIVWVQWRVVASSIGSAVEAREDPRTSTAVLCCVCAKWPRRNSKQTTPISKEPHESIVLCQVLIFYITTGPCGNITITVPARIDREMKAEALRSWSSLAATQQGVSYFLCVCLNFIHATCKCSPDPNSCYQCFLSQYSYEIASSRSIHSVVWVL